MIKYSSGQKMQNSPTFKVKAASLQNYPAAHPPCWTVRTSWLFSPAVTFELLLLNGRKMLTLCFP